MARRIGVKEEQEPKPEAVKAPSTEPDLNKNTGGKTNRKGRKAGK